MEATTIIYYHYYYRVYWGYIRIMEKKVGTTIMGIYGDYIHGTISKHPLRFVHIPHILST